MSASWADNMRAPRMKTPLLILLLFLVLTALSGTVFCQEGEEPTIEASLENKTHSHPGGSKGDHDTESSADPSPSSSDAGQSITAFYSAWKNDSGEKKSLGEAPRVHYDRVTEDTTLTLSTTAPDDLSDEGLNPIIIMIPVVLVIIIIGMIVSGIFISRRWTKKVGKPDLEKEDPYLDGSSTEKVPMPMFEEDVPSVLELEMEELDQWMRKDNESAEDS